MFGSKFPKLSSLFGGLEPKTTKIRVQIRNPKKDSRAHICLHYNYVPGCVQLFCLILKWSNLSWLELAYNSELIPMLPCKFWHEIFKSEPKLA